MKKTIFSSWTVFFNSISLFLLSGLINIFVPINKAKAATNPSGVQNSIDLSGLRDIHIPVRPNIFPFAWGYWAVGLSALLLLLIVVYVYVMWLNSKRKYALRLLAFYHQTLGDDLTRFCASSSSLLKRVALDKFGQKKVASLFGTTWADFLEKTGMEELGQNSFAKQAFLQAPYRRSVPSSSDCLLNDKEEEQKINAKTLLNNTMSVNPIKKNETVEFLFPIFKKWIIKNTKFL